MATDRTLHRLLRAYRRITREVDRALEAAGTRHELPAEPPPPGLDRLTPTEQAIIRHIAAPADPKYTAIQLDMHMSKRSFDMHLASIFEKLNVHSRAGLVRVAVLWGLG